MKQLICEMCGCTDLKKEENKYICTACGTEFIDEEESTVFEATQVFCLNNNLDYQLSADGTYLQSLLGLTEGDFTGTTGWIYEVNGEEVMVPATEYVLEEGDVISWEFIDYSALGW